MWGLLTLLVLALLVVAIVVVIRARSQDPARRPAREWTAPTASGAITDVRGGEYDHGSPPMGHAGTADAGRDVVLDDAATPASPASERAEPPAGRPLAELVHGLAWPHGLTPHVVPDQPDTQEYLAMVTTEATGPAVAASLRQELERLGYEVMALSDEDLVARRNEDLLSGRVHPRAETVNAGGRQWFPTAAPDAVAVELWAGGGPNPRAT